MRKSAPAESTESWSIRTEPTADERPDRAESRPLGAEPARDRAESRPLGAEPVRDRTELRPLGAEPVRESSGVVVKPLRRQLSKLRGATEESGVPVPEVSGVRRETGLKAGALGSYLHIACLSLGV